MPIHCPIQVRNLSKSEFDDRDKIVMRCAYDAQNALGRLCDEKVYENDVARRLREAGFRDVHTQVPVTLTHQSFRKEYRLDLIADDALYELKTVNAFVAEHDAQVLHYGMLLPVNHCKLLNFRNQRVQGRLRYNAIMTDARHCMTFDDSRWQPLSERCAGLMRHARELLSDWGAFLDFRLYEEAIIHHFGGEAHATARRRLTLDGTDLGAHRFAFHDANTCFMVSGFSDSDEQASHVRRLLAISDFNAMQWLNFHHHHIQFQTLTK